MPRGRQKLKDSYIINLEEVAFSLACRLSPNQGTLVDVVVPVYYNGDDFTERCMFLLNKKIYRSCRIDELDTFDKLVPLQHSKMRRDFSFYDQFPASVPRSSFQSFTMDDGLGLECFYRVQKEDNSAYRR